MSGGLVPSKSTVYVSNLPYSLTNNDLHQIFEKFGKVVKVTIVKDREKRQSKGIAFVLFLERESAYLCIKALNNKELFGRTLKCSIAKDNGRAAEFIKRKTYMDKSRCYECGEEGHLSYDCPQNQLGDRVHPKKKEKKGRKRKFEKYRKEEEEEEEEDDDDNEGEDPALESLSSAIQYQQQLVEKEKAYQMSTSETVSTAKRTRFRQSSYLSDDEEVIEDN